METDGHRESLAVYLDAIRRAQELDRRLVRPQSSVAFGSQAVVNSCSTNRRQCESPILGWRGEAFWPGRQYTEVETEA